MSNHTFRNSYFLFFSTTFLCWECKRSNKKIRCRLLQKRDAGYAAIQRQGQSETERWNWIRVTHRKRKGERGCLVWSDFTFSSRKVHATSAERLFLPYKTIILSFTRRCDCHIISSHIFFKIKIKSSPARVPWCSSVFPLTVCNIRQRVKYVPARNLEDMRSEEKSAEN